MVPGPIVPSVWLTFPANGSIFLRPAVLFLAPAREPHQSDLSDRFPVKEVPVKRLLLLCLICMCAAIAAAQLTMVPPRSSPADSIMVCVPYSMGWNMVSNPVVRQPGTDSIWQVFCGHGSCFYRGRYYWQCTAPNGMGLWVKVARYPTFCCIEGGPIARDTIPLTASWNMIGSISFPVAAASVETIPPGIIASRFFGYSSRYVFVDTLRPGFGYWLKASQSGWLVLSSGM